MLFLVVFLGCTAKQSKDKKASSNDMKDIEKSQQLNEFAYNLYNEIAGQEKENLAISPFSISTAMAMVYGGAAGQTKKEMSDVLLFDSDKDRFHKNFAEHVSKIKKSAGNDLELNIANGMWLQHDYPFLETYIGTISRYYETVLNKANFKEDREKERTEINNWVSDKTNNKIEELIRKDVLCEETRMVLVNAIYFLGSWLKEFDKELTHEREFNISSKDKVKTKFMKKESEFNYYEDKHAQALEIPYSGENFSMLLLLPKEDIGIRKFESVFDVNKYNQYVKNLNKSKVTVLLPKFKIRFHANLERIFQEMGMALAFSDNADFSDMTSKRDLKIDQIIHQAFVEIDEKGTEAAAATAVTVVKTSARAYDDKIVFNANRPFHFIIRDNNSNTIIFMGRVVNPKE